MEREHPDAQEAVMELAANCVGVEHVYELLQRDFTSRLPAVLVRAEQHETADVMATHRVQLEVYAPSPPEARQCARRIVRYLVGGMHATAAGLVDAIRSETDIRQVEYPAEGVALVLVSVFVDTRLQPRSKSEV